MKHACCLSSGTFVGKVSLFDKKVIIRIRPEKLNKVRLEKKKKKKRKDKGQRTHEKMVEHKIMNRIMNCLGWCCYEMGSFPQLTSIHWWRGPLTLLFKFF